MKTKPNLYGLETDCVYLYVQSGLLMTILLQFKSFDVEGSGNESRNVQFTNSNRKYDLSVAFVFDFYATEKWLDDGALHSREKET